MFCRYAQKVFVPCGCRCCVEGTLGSPRNSTTDAFFRPLVLPVTCPAAGLPLGEPFGGTDVLLDDSRRWCDLDGRINGGLIDVAVRAGRVKVHDGAVRAARATWMGIMSRKREY